MLSTVYTVFVLVFVRRSTDIWNVAGTERFSDTHNQSLIIGITLDVHWPLYGYALSPFERGWSCSEYPINTCTLHLTNDEIASYEAIVAPTRQMRQISNRCNKISTCRLTPTAQKVITVTHSRPTYQPPRSLRSSSQLLLTVPRVNLTIGQRAFCHSSPTIWNSIPLSTREAPSISTFKHRLKSFYFNSLVS